MKERVRKAYRHPLLDASIRNRRLVQVRDGLFADPQEARSMIRCMKAGIKTPIIRYVDVNRYCIFMSFVDGYTVRDYINKNLYKSRSGSYFRDER